MNIFLTLPGNNIYLIEKIYSIYLVSVNSPTNFFVEVFSPLITKPQACLIILTPDSQVQDKELLNYLSVRKNMHR